jgi:dTDP-glucose 4,6-dehydratase
MPDSVLITGADGFIGSHLTEHLVERGLRVRATALYNALDSHGWLDHIDRRVRSETEIVVCDIRDPHAVAAAMRGCGAVFHLAALIGIPYSYHSPDSYLETNVRGTLNVLQAARANGVARVVHTSTSEVYGTAREVPITEAHPLNAQSPYAASKIAADQFALSFHASFGLPVTIVRPFNTYGPRQSARAVIPTVIAQIAQRNRRIKLGATHPTRDFNFVRDIARAFAAALESPHAVGHVINVGSGYEISIGDLVRVIAEEMHAEIEVETSAERLRPAASEVERLLAGTERAHQLLQWSAEYCGIDGLRRGLRETIEWFRVPENLGRYRPGAFAL